MAMAAAATEEGGISAAPAMASVAAVDSCRPLDPVHDLLAPPLLRSFPCCLSHEEEGVVLGTGWAGTSFLKNLDSSRDEV